jgi:uncharacterized membrane protein
MEKRAQNLSVPIWAPYSLIFLGFWLFAAPGTFGFCGTSLGLNDKICGILLIVLGYLLRRPKHWILWTISIIGVWLQFVPLLFRIPQAAGYLNDTLVGVLVVFFSIILASEKESKGKDIPKGWSYNPSTYIQRFPVIILTGICWFLARYLTAYQLGFIDSMWDPFFGDGTIRVITSDISKALPVPDAGLGAFAYTLEFLLGCHGGSARWRTAPWLVLSFGLLVVPVGLVSILLIMMQPLVVHAWCTVCIITAFAMLFMIMFTIDEVAACLQLLKRGRNAGISLCRLLFKGHTEKNGAPPDVRDLPISSPMRKILSVMFLGCGMPLNLLASTLCGIIFVALPGYLNFIGPLADADHVLGALIVVASVISMAEISRKIRYFICIFASLIAIFSCFYSYGHILDLHIGLSILTFILCFRQGKLKETYG